MMFIKKKPLSPQALLAVEFFPIATKTLKPDNSIAPPSTASFDTNKYLLTFKKVQFHT